MNWRALEKEVKSFNTNADLVSEEALIALNRQIKELRDRLSDAEILRLSADTKFIEMSVAAESEDIVLMQQAANDVALNQLTEKAARRKPLKYYSHRLTHASSK